MRVQILIRLDAELAERMEQLYQLYENDPQFAGLKLIRSQIQRKALLAGVEALEREHALAKKR